MVEVASGVFGGSPAAPAVLGINDVLVWLGLQLGGELALLLQIVQVFEEQHPAGLLGVVQLAGAASVFPQYIVNGFEGLFEHLGRESLSVVPLIAAIAAGLCRQILPYLLRHVAALGGHAGLACG